VNGASSPRLAPETRRRTIVLVWAERHRGTRSAWLAESLGVGEPRYLASTSGRGWGAAWRKYPAQAFATIRLLRRERPRLIIVQSPPSFASWVAAFHARATGALLVIDAHSDAFERWIWTSPRWITAFVARTALATIVTNRHWAERVRSWGGVAKVVSSIPTTFPPGVPPELGPGTHVAVVNTWAPDEPLDAVLAAAPMVPDATFHVTGRDDRVANLPGPIPANVRFTGFLPEDRYHGLLRTADVVVCLTTRNHTMQNGASEALSHGTPIVTSDWQVLREYFAKGTAHVDNSPSGIAAGIRSVLDDLAAYRSAVDELRAERLRDWVAARSDLIDTINDRVAGRTQRGRAPDLEENG
jgi:glycosyltransferase involved in cell wall biosynthesis